MVYIDYYNNKEKWQIQFWKKMAESLVLKSPRNDGGSDQDTSICRYSIYRYYSQEVREWYIRMAHHLKGVRSLSEETIESSSSEVF